MMSNRITKQECLAKKIFGLPPNMINFTERIKAGMLLFLFEYEERKLYGVFEATTDGAMNIIPDAFQSQGKLFPAQVLFRRVWMCRPLREDEFSHVIIDNYYSPKKFDFDLSYDQVFKLVQLFYVRRINVKQDLHYIPNKIIRMFQNDYDNDGKGSRPFEKTLKPHGEHKLDSHPNAPQDTSSLEISPSSEDPISNANSSNAADVIFDRYDPTDPKIDFIQESKYEEEHNDCYDNTKRNNKSDMNASTYVVYDKSEERYPSIINPKLQSDIEVKRTSVFSRLSMSSGVAMKRKSFTESSKEPKKLESNSRRTSISLFMTEKSAFDESFADIRPSFEKIRENVERNKLEERSKHAEAETEVVPCAEADTNVVPSNESVCKKNSLPSEGSSPGKVASDDTEKGVGGLKKVVKSRNLLWFLQKTKDLKTSIS